MRCTTTSGPYQCKHVLHHAGDCEADDIPPATFGPYTDGFRGRAYLRGRLDTAKNSELDVIGNALGRPRTNAEDDCTYRERIWAVR